MKHLILCIGTIVASISSVAHSDDFHCLDGAKDPSPYKPGNVVRWCEIQKDGRLLYHGSVWRWYPKGQIQSKEFYVFGNAEGETLSWYENGKMSSLGKFSHGSKTGLWKYWSEDGGLTTEVTYGPAENAWVEYYPSRQKKAEGKSANGNGGGKIGKWTYWDDTGKEKASCDFGHGLFSLTTASCKTIADEIDPKGFNRPIPVAALENTDAVLNIASESYHFAVPFGWTADIEAGKKEQTPLVFYPKGGAWRDSGPNIYVRVLYKNDGGFEKVVKEETDGFQENVGDYAEKSSGGGKTKDGKAIITKTLSYKPLIATDSPFAIVSNDTFYETVSYVDASDQVVLLITLTCHTQSQLQQYAPALAAILGSI